MATRKIRQTSRSQPTIEGAGVHLKRAFGYYETPLFDPFLMLDDFRSDTPEHFLSGFPWHPHRGIETITYVLSGDVEHGDSIGNSGVIGSGDVQWMTAGSGIVHQELPKGDEQGRMHGFQLWANLPAQQKMMDPRYRDIKADQIPEVTMDNGVRIKVICGRVDDTTGPVKDIVIEPEYLDVSVPSGTTQEFPTRAGHTVIIYVIEGSASFAPGSPEYDNTSLLLYEDGEKIRIETAESPVRYLYFSGRPLGEPVAWRGPIVMNTQEELELAFREYREGNFIKQGSHPR